jgi:hypothetical protein
MIYKQIKFKAKIKIKNRIKYNINQNNNKIKCYLRLYQLINKLIILLQDKILGVYLQYNLKDIILIVN